MGMGKTEEPREKPSELGKDHHNPCIAPGQNQTWAMSVGDEYIHATSPSLLPVSQAILELVRGHNVYIIPKLQNVCFLLKLQIVYFA